MFRRSTLKLCFLALAASIIGLGIVLISPAASTARAGFVSSQGQGTRLDAPVAQATAAATPAATPTPVPPTPTPQPTPTPAPAGGSSSSTSSIPIVPVFLGIIFLGLVLAVVIPVVRTRLRR
ncbi:MAG TPA: hypothetical protein VH186_18985 [Chloroflexia bacterium]|nr:hypothetical protein [Chloroflexia bacterium]